MDEINEQSTAWITAYFRDKTGNLVAPSTANYRIDDVATGASVRASTALTPAPSIEITLTPSDNTILNTVGDSEGRRVTITATYGAGDQIITEHVYQVKNLAKVE